MNLQEEIREIFGYLKGRMQAHQDLGFEPPLVYARGLDAAEAERPESTTGRTSHNHADTLEDLKTQIGDCRQCKLHKARKRLVFGEGSPDARLVFVGEGPGREEDLVGEPFVGKAGELLTKIIENGMGLSRKDVYICNIVKCRPPNNRDPEGDEISACMPFLKQQIDIIRPEVICALGRVAGQALLGGDFKISRERGKWFSYMDIPLMATYHPAYLLRNVSAKRQVWDDVKKIMKHLGLEVK